DQEAATSRSRPRAAARPALIAGRSIERRRDPERLSSKPSVMPGQANSPELGALSLGLERLREEGSTDEEDEIPMSHVHAECGHADEGFGVDRSAIFEHRAVEREVVSDVVRRQTARERED